MIDPRTKEEKMEAFVDAIKKGATLIIHPDTWEEFKAHLAKPEDPLTALGLAVTQIRVIPSKFMKPGDMMALRPMPAFGSRSR